MAPDTPGGCDGPEARRHALITELLLCYGELEMIYPNIRMSGMDVPDRREFLERLDLNKVEAFLLRAKFLLAQMRR